MRPKFALLKSVIGSPHRSQLSALNASTRASIRCMFWSPNDRTSDRSTVRLPGPRYALRPEFPVAPIAGWANAAGLNQLLNVLSPYGLSSTAFTRCVPVTTPLSDRSRPVVMLSVFPDVARKIPDSRHPDASRRAVVPANCGVSALAVRLKIWFRELSQGPLSAASFASTSAGGLKSEIGSTYPVPTLSGLPPVLFVVTPSHFDNV